MKKLNYNKMNIRKRLGTAFKSIVLVFCAVSVIVAVGITILIVQYNKALVNYGFSQGDLGGLLSASAEVRSATRAVVSYQDVNTIRLSLEEHDAFVEEFEMYLAKVEKSCVSKEERELYEEIVQRWEAYKKEDAEVLRIGNTTDMALSRKAQSLLTAVVKTYYDKLEEVLLALMNEKVEKGNSLKTVLMLVGVAIVALLVGAVTGAVLLSARISKNVSDGIVNPIQQLVERFHTFAEGDLDSPFPQSQREDEIADLMKKVASMAGRLGMIINDATQIVNEMAKGNFKVRSTVEEQYVGKFYELLVGMREMNGQVSDALREVEMAASSVSHGSSNMANAAQELAAGANNQAISVEEMQATMASLTDSVKTTAKELLSASTKAQVCAKEAGSGRAEMEDLVKAMSRISETSQKIGNIISEIEDIASQTNLLSLNASIEAARAGEAGRGFAVVADEIRSLAEQSAKSAVDSRALIEDALHEVEVGNKIVASTARSLEGLVSGIEDIAQIAGNLSDMSAGQALAVEQADAGIVRISAVVQNNSATAQESSATSEELNARASLMNELVAKFQLPEQNRTWE